MHTKRIFALALLMIALLPFHISTAQDPSLDADLQSLLESYVGQKDPAVVLLVKTPDQEWIGVRGLADWEKGTPAATDDKFRIGSISKTFVAVVALQLVDEGVLGLDDVITKWLPADLVEIVPYSNQITIRQVLNHTSGIFSYTENDAFGQAVADNPTHPWTNEEAVSFIEGYDPYFKPGGGFEYSNTNFTLMAVIIERATGSTLPQQLQTRIFDPLGMENTYMEDPNKLGEGIVHGYEDFDGDGVSDDVTFVNEGNGLGDGGIITTAADLALFPPALLEGDLISDAMLDQMTDFGDNEYGLGLQGMEDDLGLWIGHGGATAGFLAEMWTLVEEEIVIVVLCNNFDADFTTDLVIDAARVALGE